MRDFVLSYQASPGCPSKEETWARIHSRIGSRPEDLDRRSTVPTIEIRIEATGRSGRLLLRDSAGHEVLRLVEGADCREVVEAMALIAAISLESTRANDAASGHGTVLAPREQPTREVGAAPPAQLPLGPQTSAPPEPLHPRPRSRTDWRALLAIQVGALAPVGPAPAWSGGALLGARWVRHSSWSPTLMVSYQRSPTHRVTAGDLPGMSAEFSSHSVRVSLCPLRIPEGGTWSASACGFFEHVWLRASGGEQMSGRRSAAVNWGALGAALRGELPLLFPLWLAPELGLVLPWKRDDFRLPGSPEDTVVYQIPAVGWAVALALGVSL